MPLLFVVPFAYVAIDSLCLMHRSKIFLFFFYVRCCTVKSSSMCSVVIACVQCSNMRVTIVEGVLALRADVIWCVAWWLPFHLSCLCSYCMYGTGERKERQQVRGWDPGFLSALCWSFFLIISLESWTSLHSSLVFPLLPSSCCSPAAPFLPCFTPKALAQNPNWYMHQTLLASSLPHVYDTLLVHLTGWTSAWDH